MVGILNLDKPRGMTSAHAVARLRRSSGERRVGHGGTLDPLATGVLPVFFGRATLLAGVMTDHAKVYVAEIRFGQASSTDDAEGELTPVALSEEIDEVLFNERMARFVGRVNQRPPAFSAISVGGERSYRQARRQVAAGATVLEPLAEREVVVHDLRLVKLAPAPPGDSTQGPLAIVEVTCGPGYYVRALARDLGAVMGTAAHLEGLRRTRVGPFYVSSSISLEEAESAGPGIAARLLPSATVLDAVGCCQVAAGSLLALGRGGSVPVEGGRDGNGWATDSAGRVLALGEVRAGLFHPRRLVELT